MEQSYSSYASISRFPLSPVPFTLLSISIISVSAASLFRISGVKATLRCSLLLVRNVYAATKKRDPAVSL